jgi:hypothetical protein
MSVLGKEAGVFMACCLGTRIFIAVMTIYPEPVRHFTPNFALRLILILSCHLRLRLRMVSTLIRMSCGSLVRMAHSDVRFAVQREGIRQDACGLLNPERFLKSVTQSSGVRPQRLLM